jgi:hypothetical protein
MKDRPQSVLDRPSETERLHHGRQAADRPTTASRRARERQQPEVLPVAGADPAIGSAPLSKPPPVVGGRTTSVVSCSRGWSGSSCSACTPPSSSSSGQSSGASAGARRRRARWCATAWCTTSTGCCAPLVAPSGPAGAGPVGSGDLGPPVRARYAGLAPAPGPAAGRRRGGVHQRRSAWGDRPGPRAAGAGRLPHRQADLHRGHLVQLDTPGSASDAEVPVVRAPNAEELLPLVRAGVGLTQPRGDHAGGAAGHWLLDASERGAPPRSRQSPPEARRGPVPRRLGRAARPGPGVPRRDRSGAQPR